MRRRCGYYKKRSRRPVVLILVILLVVSFIIIEKTLSPIVDSMAEAQVHTVTTELVNETVNKLLAENPQYQDYQKLLTIERGSDGNVELMLPNTPLINQMVTEMTTKVSKQLATFDQTLEIPAGSITGSKIFASWGPNIPIKTTSLGYVNIKITDDFIAAGVNQTRHRIWLNITSEILVSVPFIDDKVSVETTVLLTEGIIVGPVPDTYVDIG